MRGTVHDGSQRMQQGSEKQTVLTQQVQCGHRTVKCTHEGEEECRGDGGKAVRRRDGGGLAGTLQDAKTRVQCMSRLAMQ